MSGFTPIPGQPFKVIDKDPTALLDYKEDWSKWLATTPTGTPDTISGTPSWTLPVDLTVEQQLHTTQDATIWISGGVAGEQYTCWVTIQTAAGRRDKRSFIVNVKPR